MLAERRFVIDFAAGRRMVVTDDIEAKLAITEVLYRYCRALDRMDRDLMDTVWHPDATADYGPTFQGSASGLLDVMWANHAKLLGHSHQVTNVLIEIDGDRAASEAYVTGTLWDLTEAGALSHLVATRAEPSARSGRSIPALGGTTSRSTCGAPSCACTPPCRTWCPAAVGTS